MPDVTVQPGGAFRKFLGLGMITTIRFGTKRSFPARGRVGEWIRYLLLKVTVLAIVSSQVKRNIVITLPQRAGRRKSGVSAREMLPRPRSQGRDNRTRSSRSEFNWQTWGKVHTRNSEVNSYERIVTS